jgi:ATP-dependent DNA helicase DinG
LKQGFGRLIRSVKDRGVLALLDNRLLKQRYGKTFIDSLPAYKKTKDIAEVDEFFAPRANERNGFPPGQELAAYKAKALQ